MKRRYLIPAVLMMLFLVWTAAIGGGPTSLGSLAMAGLPGSTPSQLPAGEDETQRKIRDLERRMDEMGAAASKSVKPIVDKQVFVGSSAAEFGMSTAITVGTDASVPTPLIQLNVVVPAGVTNAVAFTSIVPAAYTASGTGSATVKFEVSLTSGGSGAFSYSAEQVSVVGSDTVTCTVTKSIVLTSVTPGSTITMTATAWATASGILAEGDGSLTILFLR